MTRAEAKQAKDKLYNVDFDYDGDALIDKIFDDFEAEKTEKTENHWHTGTPTVKGDYLLCYPRRNEVAEHYEVAEFDGRDFVFATGMHRVVVRTSPLSVAWQRITPYKEN